MLKKVSKTLTIALLLISTTSASAGLLWKDQEYFDRRKAERSHSIKTELHRKTAQTEKTQKNKDTSKEIMKDVEQSHRAKKIIGAMKSMSPSQFRQVFKMEKPEFDSFKTNKDI